MGGPAGSHTRPHTWKEPLQHAMVKMDTGQRTEHLPSHSKPLLDFLGNNSSWAPSLGQPVLAWQEGQHWLESQRLKVLNLTLPEILSDARLGVFRYVGFNMLDYTLDLVNDSLQ